MLAYIILLLAAALLCFLWIRFSWKHHTVLNAHVLDVCGFSCFKGRYVLPGVNMQLRYVRWEDMYLAEGYDKHGRSKLAFVITLGDLQDFLDEIGANYKLKY